MIDLRWVGRFLRAAGGVCSSPEPEIRPLPQPIDRLSLAGLILLGLVFRLFYIDAFRNQSFPPDVPWSIARAMAGWYDTFPREPLFVWWLKLLEWGGATNFLVVRTWTVLWYVPTAFLLWLGGRRLLGPWVWLALVLHAALPVQIAADANGERHVLEAFLFIAFWVRLGTTPIPDTFKGLGAAGLPLVGMFLIRLNLGASAALGWLVRIRRRREILVLSPVLLACVLAVLPHFADNKRKTGDPFRSVNIHSYWFANKEFIGRPGFASTAEEWQRDPYRLSMTYREWAFRAHSPGEYAKETVKGYPRILIAEIGGYLLAFKVPSLLRWWLIALFCLGLLGGVLESTLRPTVVYFALLILPFAFVSHVHMAPRFFAVLYPLTAILIAEGHRRAFAVVRRCFNPIRKSPRHGGRRGD